jgi:hypothetical protein
VVVIPDTDPGSHVAVILNLIQDLVDQLDSGAVAGMTAREIPGQARDDG